MSHRIRPRHRELSRLLALFLAGAGTVVILAATFSWPTSSLPDTSGSFNQGFTQGQAQSLEDVEALTEREAATSRSRGLSAGAGRGADTEVQAVRLLSLHATLIAISVVDGTYEEGFALGHQDGLTEAGQERVPGAAFP
jgi:hypothetical protein